VLDPYVGWGPWHAGHQTCAGHDVGVFSWYWKWEDAYCNQDHLKCCVWPAWPRWAYACFAWLDWWKSRQQCLIPLACHSVANLSQPQDDSCTMRSEWREIPNPKWSWLRGKFNPAGPQRYRLSFGPRRRCGLKLVRVTGNFICCPSGRPERQYIDFRAGKVK